ncbi:hypothetical protein ABB37_07523 [Leptomonas pyrrhocoris]|uniref:SKP1 component dimerisation domain-containing protein n=1 Tax=Leptomonas pyrrhocoris TaxID=157538 RepID=A0A0N0VE10_LEPPY|nr:hypothetical protein ABB37_07523 [Leptomonas pyrrhocoris]XP_015655113.1 hypothetical protein ABB37_07523 [Leptomonas pyrrhocoris]KPA76673.1 hypothetical protein ABB37_07523 [Leptomonas pyrrhocoris]KPA76674.1 hypothetical protein ABB37_07523 [Leptomonas pyrrhocoris]|eukprot:XP_015655112.1 hypothetical protein ABB37_07523 [Leptomonas pyrrhocoris]
MAQRSSPSSSTFSVNASAGQTLILIASDGVRVSVNRAVATEASYVLRDLLDGQELASSPISNNDGAAGVFLSEVGEPSTHLSAAGASMTVHDLENLFDDPAPSPTVSQSASAVRVKAAVPDLMEFFPVAPAAAATPSSSGANAAITTSSTAAGAASSSSPRVEAPTGDILASLWGPQPTREFDSPAKASTSTAQVPSFVPLHPSSPAAPPPPAEVELDFPYFTGDILERVCRHMSYRFRMSAFGAEDGRYRVYVVKTRSIPRPMTLPLVEYLDAKDRRFISDWDELTTVQMVKAATLLNYEELLQLAAAKLASYLIDRDLEGVRTFLGVDNDFDAAEEAELKKEQATEFGR